MTTDKPLPHNAEAERSVVGSLLIDSAGLDRIAAWLAPDAFYSPLLRAVYGAMLNMRDDDRPIDLVTVKDEMRTTGVQFELWQLSELTDDIPDIANLAHYAAIVKRDAARRSGIMMCESSMRAFWNDTDAATAAAALMDAVAPLVEDDADSRPVNNREMALNGLKLMEQRLGGSHEEVAVPTGFRGIDAHLDGFARGVISIVAGRPGEGKTAWMLNCAINAARAGKHVLFFSLDMSRTMLQDRLLSMVAGVDAAFVKRGRPSAGGMYAGIPLNDLMERVAEGARELAELPGSITVVDDAYDISEILVHCRTASRTGLDMVVVDYIQSVSSSTLRSEREDLRVKHVINRLNQFAKRINCAMVLLSQYNRNVYQIDRPHKGLLAEASTLERDARIIFLVWRPEMARKKDDDLPCKTTIVADKASEYGERDFDMHYEGACYTFKEQAHGDDCYYWKGEGH